MQPTTKTTTTFEHNNISYATEFSELFDESSALSLASQGPTTSIVVTPPVTPFRVEKMIKSPNSPGRNIDMMMVKKTKVNGNRRTLLQRFKSISRRRKMVDITREEESLSFPLPVVEENNNAVAKKPVATTPWESYSKKNYFRGVFSS
ncbi:MAG: hypothetical protein SGBAC_012135 [Bacillariaceae sp.]